VTEPTTANAAPMTAEEERVLEAAKLYVTARQSFNRMRTSGRHSGGEVVRARARLDQATELLVSAVEELPS
jgi:hypothetical protein